MSKVDISYDKGEDVASFGRGAEPRTVRRRRVITSALITDAIALWEAAFVVLTAWAVKIVYLDIYLAAVEQSGPYIRAGFVLALIVFSFFRRLGLYKPDRLRQPLRQIRRLLLGLGGSFLVLVAVLYLFKEAEQFSRGWMLLWFAASCIVLVSGRILLHACLKSRPLRDVFHQRIAVYGAGELGKSVVDYLRGMAADVEVVGVFDDRKSLTRGVLLPVDGGLSTLVDFGKRNLYDQIIVAVPASEERLARVLDQLSILPVDVQLCPEIMNLPCTVFGFSKLGRLRLLDVQRRPMTARDQYIKATMDFVLGVIILALVLPIFPLIALAIKLDSSGPVFFRQRRHGYNHQIIRILKFRTMTVLEDGAVVQQVRNGDARVTRVGRFLRATNLDELPQVLNVLKGEMSLVGPRPHALAHDAFYAGLVKRYGCRLRVKPGITGWAQINGFSGETSEPNLMRKRVECDLNYIENWSVWLDLEIILLTIYLTLTGRLEH